MCPRPESKPHPFPPPESADDRGLVAIGGELSVGQLLLAYRSGIFPWPVEGSPPLWFSPDPRAIILPGNFRVPRRLTRTIRSGGWTFTWDTAFPKVIDGCARGPRRRGGGTWITPQVRAAFLRLHNRGHAHSIEVWRGDTLAGGLYGVSLGRCFFAESMVGWEHDASSVALAELCRQLFEAGWAFVDTQFATPHLERFGCLGLPRSEYLRRLAESVDRDGGRAPWRGGDI